MARPSATAALLFLLLAVAHCRTLELEAQPAAGGDGDENGPPNPTLPGEEALPLPAEQQQHGFLRLPSHRPCHHGPSHRHHLSLWWARRLHHRRHGDALGLGHLAALPLPTEEAPAEEEEVNKAAVAEPDPDRSLPDTDDSEEADHHEHEVRAWRKEMQRRSWPFQFHRHHHHHDDDEEEEAAEEGVKRLHSHDEDEGKQHTMITKRFRRADHDGESDSDDDDEEVEELVRRFRMAIMRRRRGFAGHGRRFHHHRRRHAEKAADAQEGNGVVPWIKGLFNRF
ncbi:unnamed protein product [Urochloa humidicola]